MKVLVKTRCFQRDKSDVEPYRKMGSCVPEDDAIYERIAPDEIDAIRPPIVMEFEARALARQLIHSRPRTLLF